MRTFVSSNSSQIQIWNWKSSRLLMKRIIIRLRRRYLSDKKFNFQQKKNVQWHTRTKLINAQANSSNSTLNNWKSIMIKRRKLQLCEKKIRRTFIISLKARQIMLSLGDFISSNWSKKMWIIYFKNLELKSCWMIILIFTTLKIEWRRCTKFFTTYQTTSESKMF